MREWDISSGRRVASAPLPHPPTHEVLLQMTFKGPEAVSACSERWSTGEGLRHVVGRDEPARPSWLEADHQSSVHPLPDHPPHCALPAWLPGYSGEWFNK